MVDLYRREDDALIGAVSDGDLQFLVDTLEEEDSEDTDYYVDADTLDYLKGRGASSGLLAVLGSAVDGRDGAEVYYLVEGETEAPEDDTEG